MITRPTMPDAIIGIGWGGGMGRPGGLPSMSVLRPRGNARIGPAGLRARSRRQFLRDDLLKKSRSCRSEGKRRDVLALLGQGIVSFRVEGWARVARCFDPAFERVRWQCQHVEMHIRETIATIVARKAAEGARAGRLPGGLRL